MSRFARLRRSVALIICPEMGVEARLKATREKRGFFCADAAQQVHDHAFEVAKASAPKEPFLPPDRMAELLATLRHSRIERAKEILKIVQEVQLAGLLGNEHPALDLTAERLAVLIFGKQ